MDKGLARVKSVSSERKINLPSVVGDLPSPSYSSLCFQYGVVRFETPCVKTPAL